MLRCEECGTTANDDGRGWKAYLGSDPREDDDDEVFVFCPECAEREFGENVGER